MADKIEVLRVTAPEFARYGTILNAPVEELLTAATRLEMPSEGAKYEPSIAVLEQCSEKDWYTREIFGELPIQIGCCWGHNRQLNALEWHKSSEINIAVTDMVLMLARLDDLEEGRLDSRKVRAFEVKKGEAVEIYAPTLHFCPCTTEERGFSCIVILPQGTNVPLDAKPLDPLLFRKNKWILCHESNESLLDRGVKAGIYGPNWNL